MFTAEVVRILSRRSFRIIGALCVFGVVLSGVIVFFNSSHDPQSGLKEAQAYVARCEAAMKGAPTERGPQDVPGLKVAIGGCPTVEGIRPSFDRRFYYARTMPDASRHVSIPLFFLACIVSASFVGAEWGSGMMTTTLTWEPRRGRVLAAKAVPALIVIALAVVAVLVLLAVAYVPIAAFRGSMHGMSAAFWQHMAGIWLRAAGVAAFGAALGVGLATLARNTVAAIGIGFGYGAILDPILSALWKGRFAPWLWSQNFARLLGLPVERRSGGPVIGGAVTLVRLSATRPILLLSIYAAALIAAAYAAFRYRDVT